MDNPPVKLLDRVRQRIRLKGYSIRTEKSYVSWIKRFVLFHGKRHSQEMGKVEIEVFLSHLVLKRNRCLNLPISYPPVAEFTIIRFEAAASLRKQIYDVDISNKG